MTPREQAKMARYDLVQVTRCGEGWQEMERADEYGDWVTYADHVAALADARRAGLEEAAKDGREALRLLRCGQPDDAEAILERYEEAQAAQEEG